MIRHHPSRECYEPACPVCWEREQSKRIPIPGTRTDAQIRADAAEAAETGARMARYDRNP